MLSILSRVQGYVTTDGQSTSLSSCKASIWDLRPDFLLIVAGLLMSGALSDVRTGLSFTTYNEPYIYVLHVIMTNSTLHGRLCIVSVSMGKVS
jgi:hypothetical protein